MWRMSAPISTVVPRPGRRKFNSQCVLETLDSVTNQDAAIFLHGGILIRYMTVITKSD